MAQGAQGSVKKNRKVYLSGEGVIGEAWLPPHAVNTRDKESVIRRNIHVYRIIYSFNEFQRFSISNTSNYPKRKMTDFHIGNIAYWMEPINYGEIRIVERYLRG